MRLILVVLCLSACASKQIAISEKHPDNVYCERQFDIHDKDAQVGCLIDLQEAHDLEEYLSRVHKTEVK